MKIRKTRNHERDIFVAVVCFVIAALGFAACTRAHAKTTPDAPGLEMPLPPPHDVEPIEAEPLTSTTTAEPDETAKRPARPRPAPPVTREAPKPETKPAEPAKPEAPPEPPKPE